MPLSQIDMLVTRNRFCLMGYTLKDVYNELPFEVYIEDIDQLFV